MLPPLSAYRHKLLPLRAQADLLNTWLKQRLDSLLPALMAREGLDCWLVVAREYNEDPVIMSLLPQPAMSARRRTVLAFFRRPDGTVERLTISRYGLPGYYEGVWEPDQESQESCLRRIVAARDPQRIGINVLETTAFGDGLSHHEHGWLVAALGDAYGTRLSGAGRMAIGWLEQRIPAELTAYPALVQMGHALIAEAFSDRVVHPGVTTSDDVVWWLREQMAGLGLRAWFQPTVTIQAPGQGFEGFATENPPRRLILPGDLLHVDVGFTYLDLTTDQQQHAYVLRPGEREAPAGLQAALADANRLQDLHLAQMAVGRSGNEVLRETLAAARAAGIDPQVYSHPIGLHGHAAGPTIGLWDRQEGVPGAGDLTLVDNTCYSIELNARRAVPEWGDQVVRIALEEDAVLSGGVMRWLDGRQEQFHLLG